MTGISLFKFVQITNDKLKLDKLKLHLFSVQQPQLDESINSKLCPYPLCWHCCDITYYIPRNGQYSPFKTKHDYWMDLSNFFSNAKCPLAVCGEGLWLVV